MKQNKTLHLCCLLVIVSSVINAQTPDYTAQSRILRSDLPSKSVLVSSAETSKVIDKTVIGAASLKEGDKELEYRSLLQFDLNLLPADIIENPSRIASAQLILYPVPLDFQESDESKPSKFIIRRVVGSWEDSATQWNNKPDADEESETTKLIKVQHKDDQVTITVTRMVRDMITKGNNGFMICPYSSSEELLASGQLFASPKNENKELRPVLIINYWKRVSVIISTPDESTVRPSQWQTRVGQQRYNAGAPMQQQ